LWASICAQQYPKNIQLNLLFTTAGLVHLRLYIVHHALEFGVALDLPVYRPLKRLPLGC